MIPWYVHAETAQRLMCRHALLVFTGLCCIALTVHMVTHALSWWEEYKWKRRNLRG